MDTETKKEFNEIKELFRLQTEQFERIATMVAEGFADVHTRIDFVHSSLKTEMTEMRLEFKGDVSELREEIRSIRADIAILPDDVDEMYSKTITDLLDRVTYIEQRLKMLEQTRS